MMTYVHVELLQFLLLASSSRRSFLRTAQSIQQYVYGSELKKGYQRLESATDRRRKKRAKKFA